VEALKNENNGQFEKAISTYEIALNGFRKNRSGANLRKKIIAKVKVLHTVIDYKNTFQKTLQEYTN
jgi:hypothetical protein